jgi:uncharacterized phiE125 gp8 family phage protein
MGLPTLSEVKLHLRVDGDQEDSLILSLIASAVEHFEQSTRRVLARRTIVQKQNGLLPRHTIMLEKGPVTSVTSLTIRKDDSTFVTIPPTDYIVNCGQTETIPLLAIRTNAQIPQADNYPGSVVVTYVAETIDIPQSINAAIKLLVAHWYENRQAVGPTGGGEVPLAYSSIATKYLWGAYL